MTERTFDDAWYAGIREGLRRAADTGQLHPLTATVLYEELDAEEKRDKERRAFQENPPGPLGGHVQIGYPGCEAE